MEFHKGGDTVASLTGDPKIDALLIKHADEIRRLEELGREKAEENDRLIAKFHESRAKRLGAADAK